jgi:hypothetical protein
MNGGVQKIIIEIVMSSSVSCCADGIVDLVFYLGTGETKAIKSKLTFCIVVVTSASIDVFLNQRHCSRSIIRS